jgi:putative FmdB family regulatory protein
MPIYEFYCPKCHMLFDFFSRRIDTETRPTCPRCKKVELTRQVSSFAVVSSRGEGDQEGEMAGMPDIDESKLERAMTELASAAENIDENDPVQSAKLMRKLSDMTGMEMGPGMKEALRRMEAGEDPEQVEQELGDVLEEEEPFMAKGPAGRGGGSRTKKRLPPKKDDTLHEL